MLPFARGLKHLLHNKESLRTEQSFPPPPPPSPTPTYATTHIPFSCLCNKRHSVCPEFPSRALFFFELQVFHCLGLQHSDGLSKLPLSSFFGFFLLFTWEWHLCSFSILSKSRRLCAWRASTQNTECYFHYSSISSYNESQP